MSQEKSISRNNKVRSAVLYLVLLIIGLLLGASLNSVLFNRTPVSTSQQQVTVVPIGALLELTGDLASYGKRDQAALELAVQDINAFAESIGSPFRFRLLVEDTATTPEQALSKLQALAAQGVQAVVGLEASSEVSSVKQFADANKIVVISIGSTATSLAITGDYIFRVVPTDAFQGRALARLVWSDGFKNAAVIYRNDAWGKGLYDAFSARFQELGGRVVGVPYDPNAQDVSGEVARLAQEASNLGAATAVVLISFEDDGIRVIQAAVQNPTLSQLKWYGTDGVALSTKFTDQIGQQLASLGGFPCTIFQPANNPQQERFIHVFQQKTGEYPHSYAMNAYDAAWLIALSVMATGQYSGEAIAKALPTIAQHYFGVTGNTALDQNGDRVAGDYAVWAVIKTQNGYDWVQIAQYNSLTDQVSKV
ncbi:MAG: ABC transporter substrate-binding protein [Infirmifilum sp.]